MCSCNDIKLTVWYRFYFETYNPWALCEKIGFQSIIILRNFRQETDTLLNDVFSCFCSFIYRCVSPLPIHHIQQISMNSPRRRCITIHILVHCVQRQLYYCSQVTWQDNPDSKVHGANMGSIWADRTQVGPMLAPWALLSGHAPTLGSGSLATFAG